MNQSQPIFNACECVECYAICFGMFLMKSIALKKPNANVKYRKYFIEHHHQVNK